MREGEGQGQGEVGKGRGLASRGGGVCRVIAVISAYNESPRTLFPCRPNKKKQQQHSKGRGARERRRESAIVDLFSVCLKLTGEIEISS